MRLPSLFASSVEKNLAVRLVIVLIIPMLALSVLATQQIRSQSQELTQQHLAREAKDYGMLLAERIQMTTLNWATQYNAVSPEPTIRLPLRSAPGDIFVIDLTPLGVDRTVRISLSELTFDLEDVDHITRCVALQQNTCTAPAENTFSAMWQLRLLSLYDTDTSIYVTTWIDESKPLLETTLLVELFPQLTALILILALYTGALFLRTRLQPLGELKSAVRAIAAGNLGHQIKTSGSDEFGELGSAFNSMSQELDDAFGFQVIIAEVDESILSGSDLKTVFASCVKALVGHCGVRRAVFCEATADHWRMYQSEEGGSVREKVFHEEPDIETLIPNGRAFPILDDKRMAGCLVVDHIAKHAEKRVLEVVRKLAVGCINMRRSIELYQQANYDGLTGLLNRTSFAFQLARKIAFVTRTDTSGMLIFLDLDEFKKVNDSEGHPAGDRLLQVVADRLTNNVRQDDMVARLGGDEFAIALDAFESELDLVNFMKRLIQDIECPIKIGKLEVPIRASMGVCVYPRDGDSVEVLLKNADIAMYRAKNVSGSSFIFYDDSLNVEAERQMLIESKLRQAIQENKIELYLQPKLDIRTGRITSSEALSRWVDEDLGFVPPDEFIAVAERSGLIEALTNNIFANVGRLLFRHPDRLQRIAVNISPRELERPKFAEKMIAILRKYKVNHSSIELEVTESNFMDKPEKVARILQEFRDEGIRISLDDFGTGYSSLNLLRQLPLDYLKIDKSFIDEITEESMAHGLVKKIIEIAKSLGMGVVAEGVETDQQLRLLERMSCTYVQGYLISQPLPAEEAIEFIEDWNERQHGSSVAQVF